MRDNRVTPKGVSKAILILGAVLVASYAGSAEAAAANPSGFWAGLGDGFLSLVKLLLSLVMKVTLFDSEARSMSYDVGFFLGVFGFAGFAGAVDAAFEPEPVGRFGTIQTPHVALAPSAPKGESKEGK